MPINFSNKKAVIATMHGKEKIIAPILQSELQIESFVPTHFNTDQFGTFTRDIKRKGNQLEAARAKAKAAVNLLNTPLAIASEGSFSEHPTNPFLPYNIEIVLLLDTENKLEVVGYYASTKTNMNQIYVRSIEEALNFAKTIGFPQHGLIVRKNERDTRHMVKGIMHEDELESCIKKLLSRPFVRKVFLETDMRAHCNPTRMENIRLATLNLVNRLKQLCPKCEMPGFGFTRTKGGLPCEICRSPTNETLIKLFECPTCKHLEEDANTNQFAPAMMCAHCNP